jgi:hypothetical protein
MEDDGVDIIEEPDFVSPSIVEGLPPDAILRSRDLQALANRGVFRLIAQPGYKAGIMEVITHPRHGGTPYVRNPSRNNICYRDTERTGIRIVDKGDILERHYAEPSLDMALKIVDLQNSDVIYRGMCSEEFHVILKTGILQSSGDYNMSGQENLTYFSELSDAAASYANSFAPLHSKPTFGCPAYVVAIQRPLHVRHVPGTAEHEVGVIGSIDVSEVLAVWQGRVFDYDPGYIEIRNDGYGTWTTGSMFAPSIRVLWERVSERALEAKLGIRNQNHLAP